VPEIAFEGRAGPTAPAGAPKYFLERAEQADWVRLANIAE
jgi:hypothetical protein